MTRVLNNTYWKASVSRSVTHFRDLIRSNRKKYTVDGLPYSKEFEDVTSRLWASGSGGTLNQYRQDVFASLLNARKAGKLKPYRKLKPNERRQVQRNEAKAKPKTRKRVKKAATKSFAKTWNTWSFAGRRGKK